MQATREEVLKLVKQSIDELAIEELQQVPQKLQNIQTQQTKTKAQRVQDAEDALFRGFEKDWDNTRKIKLNEEEEERIKIGNTELESVKKTFLDSISKKLSGSVPSVKFDIQPDSKKIMSFPQLPEGKEFFMSGNISFGSGKVLLFGFSFLNGMKITTKDFIVDKENRNIIGALYEIYTDWKNTWNERVIANNVAGNALQENNYF